MCFHFGQQFSLSLLILHEISRIFDLVKCIWFNCKSHWLTFIAYSWTLWQLRQQRGQRVTERGSVDRTGQDSKQRQLRWQIMNIDKANCLHLGFIISLSVLTENAVKLQKLCEKIAQNDNEIIKI